jgi:hypothetical protein
MPTPPTTDERRDCNPRTPAEYRTRDRLLTGGPIDWDSDDARHGTVHFTAVPVGTLEYCVLRGWADYQTTQNDAPSIGTVVSWGLARERHDGCRVWVDGYVVAPRRHDERVSVTTVRVETGLPTEEWRALLIDHPPDEESMGPAHAITGLPAHYWAWWD